MAQPRFESRLSQLQKELDRLFVDTRGGLQRADEQPEVAGYDWIPAVDIKEEQDHFLLRADLPGVAPGAIEISAENGVLTLKGERGSKTEPAQGYTRMERARGAFYRRFSLPETADPENISAKSRNGVLDIVIPKHARVKSRKISVQS